MALLSPNFQGLGTTTSAPSGAQWNAIQNGANQNSLVSQLFAGKPKTSVTQTPQVTAASSAVKNPNAPAQVPNQPQPITGDTTTPSGATVNATSGTLVASPPTNTTFGGIVGNLANTSAQGNAQEQQAEQALVSSTATGNQLPNAYAAQTAEYGAGNIPIGQQAESIANNAENSINQVAEKAAEGGIGMLSGGALNPIALGRAGAIENQAAQEQQALAAAAQVGLQGTSQALTGQNQAATAANEAGSITNTAQSNVQSGLENAGQLGNTAQTNIQSGEQAAGALSQPTGTYPFVFNPQTGTFTNSSANSSGGVLDAGQAAQGVLSGNMTYDQAVSSLGYLGQTGTAQLQSAILAQNPNADISQLQAQGAANQSNTTTQVTTPTQTAAQGYSNAVQTYNTANATYQTVTSQGNTLLQTMQQTGVNQKPQFVNTPINGLQNQFGSANYTAFQAALTETQQAYESLLGAVGAATPTVNGVAATSLLTTSSTPGQISAALQQLQTAAYNKLLPLYNQIGIYQGQLQGGNNAPANSNPSSGTPVTAGGYSFVQNAQGQWVPAS
jgi:hypothetical protein